MINTESKVEEDIVDTITDLTDYFDSDWMNSYLEA